MEAVPSRRRAPLLSRQRVGEAGETSLAYVFPASIQISLAIFKILSRKSYARLRLLLVLDVRPIHMDCTMRGT